MKRQRSSHGFKDSTSIDSSDDERGRQNDLVSSDEPEGESEIHNVSSDIRLGLEECLQGLTATAFLAFSGQMRAVNPCISISGLGTVDLPLSERDAELILSLCYQTPYGRGSETVVDTAVRHTWDLNTDQFELMNPEWNTVLEKICSQSYCIRYHRVFVG